MNQILILDVNYSNFLLEIKFYYRVIFYSLNIFFKKSLFCCYLELNFEFKEEI